jgi:hypothetical protein
MKSSVRDVHLQNLHQQFSNGQYSVAIENLQSCASLRRVFGLPTAEWLLVSSTLHFFSGFSKGLFLRTTALKMAWAQKWKI